MKEQYVCYEEDKYVVIYQYDSGYCEIKKVDNPLKIELVHRSELIRWSEES